MSSLYFLLNTRGKSGLYRRENVMKETEKNLQHALKDEAFAKFRYKQYAEVADELGYPPLERLFKELSHIEKEHAEILFEELHKDIKLVDLKETIQAELQESNETYLRYAATAKEENMPDLSKKFEMLAAVEGHHAELLSEMFQRIDTGNLFKRGYLAEWECKECGRVIIGKEPPIVCPLCGHKNAYEVIN